MTKAYLRYRTRIIILTSFVMISWLGLCVRLFQIQVLNGNHYQKIVERQAQKKQTISATRGNIFDRKSRALTRNIIHYTLSVNPKEVNDKASIAKAISKRTGKPEKYYLKKMNSDSKFEYLERNLQRETLGSLETTNFKGLNIEREYRRYYPHNEIAAQVIGYTNLDDKGISGIEKDYNDYLTGKSGWIFKTKGWSGKIQHKSGMPFQEPINGENIQLTINLEYQTILEEELLKRQKITSAISATGIIMDPETGEILAIASTPGFNNNKFNSTEQNSHRIRAITDQFEPGSTYKIVSAVSALYDKKISLKNEFNCENGTYKYFTININDHEPHGMLTIPQIIYYSSNIGTIKIAEEIGPNIFYSISRDLGFGQKTGISLNGEVTGKLKPVKEWSAVSLGEIAMGHEVGVTAIQLASAYAAIANGGYLLKPRIVKQVMDSDGNIVYSEKSEVIRQIADEETMGEVRKMLRGVIIDGTGKNANLQGWQVAGKTGTAQKWNNGKYSNNRFISNFIGFFPYENPQLLAFVMLDEPKQPYHWGGEGAAPAFRNIMSRIINMDDGIIPPIKNNDIIVSEYEDNDIVESSIASINHSNKLPPTLSSIAEYSNKAYVPDLRGLSMRRAMETLGHLGLRPKVKGSGKVLSQNLMPGTLVNKGTVCAVELQ
tara:strand:- start:1511 stop:3493 length:1983 start_codon:yes stop_codon:yes gene_type:complete